MLMLTRRAILAGALAPLAPRLSWAQATEIRVISSGGFTAAYNILAPRFEKMTGKKIASA
jgi:molybdate transport system substrate-binding protein